MLPYGLKKTSCQIIYKYISMYIKKFMSIYFVFDLETAVKVPSCWWQREIKLYLHPISSTRIPCANIVNIDLLRLNEMYISGGTITMRLSRESVISVISMSTSIWSRRTGMSCFQRGLKQKYPPWTRIWSPKDKYICRIGDRTSPYNGDDM